MLHGVHSDWEEEEERMNSPRIQAAGCDWNRIPGHISCSQKNYKTDKVTITTGWLGNQSRQWYSYLRLNVRRIACNYTGCVIHYDKKTTTTHTPPRYCLVIKCSSLEWVGKEKREERKLRIRRTRELEKRIMLDRSTGHFHFFVNLLFL